MFVKEKYGKIDLKIFETRDEMGKSAANKAAALLRKLLKEQDEVSCVFAAAPSQNEFFQHLLEETEIDWSRVVAFHMDEYINLSKGDKNSFGTFLYENFFSKVNLKKVYYINGKNDKDAECKRYSEIIEKYNLDIVFCGIGENGHIAFNDPPVADFNDKEIIKPVMLDDACRQQQVNDGCFKTIDDVPLYALTLTIPVLCSAQNIFCIVPSDKKADAVRCTLKGEVSEKCPASILQETDNVYMYLDREAASKL